MARACTLGCGRISKDGMCQLRDGPEEREKMNKNNGLTHDEIAVACRNIGINLECGGCAENFYTGYNDPNHHDSHCSKKQKVWELVKVRRIAGSVCISLPKTVLSPLNIECGDKVLLEVDMKNSRLIVKKMS